MLVFLLVVLSELYLLRSLNLHFRQVILNELIINFGLLSWEEFCLIKIIVLPGRRLNQIPYNLTERYFQEEAKK